MNGERKAKFLLDRAFNCDDACHSEEDCGCLKAIIGALGQPVEWQPIETAPKDGTEFLWCDELSHKPGKPWSFSVIHWPTYEECFDSGYWQPLIPPKPEKPIRRTWALAGQCLYCDEHRRRGDKFLPPHDASPRCESGKFPHCTCDVCF